MSGIFSLPFVLFGLSAIPVLVAIYLLRNRFRLHTVSSLMLWEQQTRVHQQGKFISRIQTPLLFFLELLVLLMLVLAAAGPLMRTAKDTRHFVFVLDDSYSMLADDNGIIARDEAVKEIEELLDESGRFSARFISAGSTPQLIAESLGTWSQVNALLGRWRCMSASADMARAVNLALELAGKDSHILVVTDHKPDTLPGQGRLEWWAFGRPLANVAFINATRKSFDLKQRCFLEIANLSVSSMTRKLTIESLKDSELVMQRLLEFEPKTTNRIFFEPEDNSAGLRAYFTNDSLAIDNEVILLPEINKIVRVQIAVEDKLLAGAVKLAVDASKHSQSSSIEPHLIITDAPLSLPSVYDSWTFRIINKPNASAFLGPFIMNRSHPLTQGLSLDGVIWSASDVNNFSGVPVVAAGNVPLLMDRETLNGQHHVSINLTPEFSTLFQSPNWPILFWNLIEWRKTFLPGPLVPNVSLGAMVSVSLDTQMEQLTLKAPDGQSGSLAVNAKTVSFQPQIPGLYELTDKGQSMYQFAVNPLSKSESDLSRAQTGKWGRWQQAELFWWEYRPVDWFLLLIALSLLTAHRFVTAAQQRGGA